MRISDWSSDVCSSDLTAPGDAARASGNAQAAAAAVERPAPDLRRPVRGHGRTHRRHRQAGVGMAELRKEPRLMSEGQGLRACSYHLVGVAAVTMPRGPCPQIVWSAGEADRKRNRQNYST